MGESITSNSRIAKNTIFLYARMIVVLLVGLYSSRVILASLGVVDYGIYNVVGSIVVLFSYLDTALSVATARFYSFELPSGVEKVKEVFNTSIIIQIVFALIILFLAETIGLWLVNYKLVIPPERMTAANIVYQFSIATTVVQILSVPLNASITSHERMSVYAILSLVDSFLKLSVALLISVSPIDNLVFYGGGLLIISIIVFIIKYRYCKYNFEEICYQRKFSRPLLKRMFAFAGWNFFGATAGMSVGQGLNFIINIFFGPAINAARGIAFQVQGALNQFVTNVNTAVNPQIVKRYSIGEKGSMFKLVFFSSKLSFLLLLIVSMPIIIDAPYVLELWLKEVPDQTVLFTRLVLIYMLTISVTYSINMSAQASGNIKRFQIAEGSIILLNIPVVLVLFYMGMPAYVSFLSMIVFSVIAFLVKLFILSKIIKFPIRDYVKEVISKLAIISLVCVFVFVMTYKIEVNTLPLFVIKTLVYCLPLSIVIWVVGFSKNEKEGIKSLLRKHMRR